MNNNTLNEYNYDNNDVSLFSDIDRKMRFNQFNQLIVYTNDYDVITQSIKNILVTEKGSRVRFPEFGTNLKHFLFEPIDSDIIEAMEDIIKEAIETWENRVIVQNVIASLIKPDQNLVEIEITYYIKHSGKLENFRGRIAPPE